MPISQNLRKFLTANGIDSNTAQTVASGIQRKAQRNTGLKLEEITLVYEYIQRVNHNHFETLKLQRLIEQSPLSTTENAGKLGMKIGRVGVGVKGMGDKIYKIPNPPSPITAKPKPTRTFVKSWNLNGNADGSPLPSAMIRQLAYKVASF
jgi:hypothetical protein